MAEPETIPAREYGRVRLERAHLTDHDLAVLSAINNDLIACAPAGGGWELTIGPICGVLELEGCRVVIGPKLMPDGSTVVSWIGYAAAAPTNLEAARGWSVGQDGLREVIIAALVTECGAILRDGLHRDYRRRAAVDTVLRGRLDLARQISRRYGQVDQLYLNRFDRESDIWENLACRAALDHAARSSSSVAQRRAAASLASGFPPCAAENATVRRWLASGSYHRLNARYRAAHLWAGLLLGGGGVQDMLVIGEYRAGTLLINMNSLWERVVQRLCRDLSDASMAGPAPLITVREQGFSSRTLLPDAYIAYPSDGQPRYRPVDAKYKHYAARPLARDDTHQLLTYAAAFKSPDGPASAVVAYPTIGPGEVRAVDVHGQAGHLGSIRVAGIDVTAGPARALDMLCSACEWHAPGPGPERHSSQVAPGWA